MLIKNKYTGGDNGGSQKGYQDFFVPERVEEARKSASNGRRITNKEIASKLNVSERHISVILNGKAGVSYALAEEIAKSTLCINSHVLLPRLM